MSLLESAKRAAAFAAVAAHVTSDSLVGVGSGSTVVHAVQALKEKAESEGKRIKCVPTSFQVNLAI